ncbi:tRNA (guanosine(37)-N1)-methyltransferase TrmD [Candidatus Gottesmanbacteria bacterium]|nr:tRNA (guanosine(37)-N1)-methyltransferase TrmD [Candidatus Gottesmanbacteria bacterium]
MTISILTLFPSMFAGPFDYSIVRRAQEKGIATINLVNIRDFATDKYKSVDDHPYGGGVGMVMRVDVIDRALESQKSKVKSQKSKTILLDPRGKTFTQKKAREFSQLDHLILVCGHYEGVDERVHEIVDESISIGDYVLTGGEIPAMVITDSVVRLLPGVLKKESAKLLESFTQHHMLEHPQYTRPEVYKGMTVPAVLKSGNHKRIEEWRKKTTTVRKDRASLRRRSG